MASSTLKFAIFLGSTREGRQGLRVAKFMKNQLEARNYQVELFDPLELKFPLLEKAFHHYENKSDAPQWMQDCDTKLRAADAFVVVSAEYNHSIPPALANMMDHFGESAYAYKPSGIVTYASGIGGGVRAAMQLRIFLGVLGCLSVSDIFSIPKVHEALTDEGKPLNDHMISGAGKLITQLEWMAAAMKNHRDAVGIPK
ncbi:FMN-dependent NADPH-azoreductase [Aplysia californica]|uniref:FMN-dependent NADPH-azoreductase n=1 Tax=Aplysia californica TaxID=6500 RepID=A0ABM0K833_APLCA|nr:FMN-dependent NADPH-azoreductase [Aplysia californica]